MCMSCVCPDPCLTRTETFHLAVDAFQRASSLCSPHSSSGSSDLLYCLGAAQVQAGQLEEAKSTFTKVLGMATCLVWPCCAYSLALLSFRVLPYCAAPGY